MTTQIHYFTGTGNSLTVARTLANKLGATLHPMAAALNRDALSIESDALGLVFPVYHKSIPLILKRFVEKLERIEGTYLFAVYTYGDSPGLAARHLTDLIEARGGRVAAGFGVHMPYNYLTPTRIFRDMVGSFTLREISDEKRRTLIAEAPATIDRIAAYIRARKSGALEVTADPLTRLADSLNLPETLAKSIWLKVAGVANPPNVPFLESRQWMDEAFYADETCIGCATCAHICPVRNIQMIDDPAISHPIPEWHHRCEQCFACLQWCPQVAIQFGANTTGKLRYHHPDITLADMRGQATHDNART
jgi:formate hydrogenlyase subunit 6/NADH:ubiquinone oxidoreductase subunit I/flavodoxin